MAITYDTFLPEVAPHVAGAPEPLVVNAIRNAAIEFCMRSWVYQVTLGPITITPFVQEYAFAAGTFAQPALTTVQEIMWAKYNGRFIDPVTKADLNLDQYKWQSPTPSTATTAVKAKCANRPNNYYSDQGSSLIGLTPIPNVAPGASDLGLYVQVALSPTRTSTGVPDWIYESYLEDIAKGALAKLFMMPHKAWTNANLGGTYKAAFITACADARVDSAKSFTRAPLRNRSFGVARW